MKSSPLLVMLAALLACGLHGCAREGASSETPPVGSSKTTAVGPLTVPVPVGEYSGIYHVSGDRGSDGAEGNGSKDSPWQTLGHALSQIAGASETGRRAILVSEGDYSEATIRMRSFVDVYGGHSVETWERDIYRYPSVLDGEKTRRILIGADDSRIDGFVIEDGQVRGKGGGILCEGVSPTISNNRFVGNRTLGPSDWKPRFIHETAHDGGAIYAGSGGSPVIERNLFVANRTENGRGGAVALDGKCGGRIAGNLFYRNVAGLDDPMRSSDGGAISIFNWSDPVVEQNIVLSNRADSRNDGGGIFVALWSSPVIRDNIIVNNWGDDDAGGLFVGGQEHRYDRPLDPLPPQDEFFVPVSGNLFMGNGNPSGNSGTMRFTMEARGDFSNNLVVNSNGVYFQRCEVTIRNNTILDDFLFVETKEGLKPGRIFNNLIWGDFQLLEKAEVASCNIKGGFAGEGNIQLTPEFLDDRLEVAADVVRFRPGRHTTEVFGVGLDLHPGELVGRVVRAGRSWGVVKSNDQKSVEIWGNLSEEFEFVILPSYHLRPGSPGIDSGTSTDAPERDIDGDARPWNDRVDIGADEFVGRDSALKSRIEQ